MGLGRRGIGARAFALKRQRAFSVGTGDKTGSLGASKAAEQKGPGVFQGLHAVGQEGVEVYLFLGQGGEGRRDWGRRAPLLQGLKCLLKGRK